MFQTELDAPWYRPEDNLPFSCYAKHTQETEDIINQIVNKARVAQINGLSNANFSIDLDDDFSDEDIEYIKREVSRRI